jgi:hypothetical protein
MDYYPKKSQRVDFRSFGGQSLGETSEVLSSGTKKKLDFKNQRFPKSNV